MGKIQGIFQFTGKVGQAVGMKGDNGERYVREYVKTSNPDTKDQQEVRTVMSLAGKISKLTNWQVITGLTGANKRQRRAIFVRNIVLNSTVGVVDGANQASLNPAKLILSEGNSLSLPTLTNSISGNMLTVVPSAWPDNALDAVIIVAYGIDANGDYVDCQTKTIVTGTTLAVNIQMADTVVKASVYCIPVTQNTSVSSTRYAAALEALSANSEFAVTSGGTENSALAYQQSSFNGVVTPGA